jgi:predicted ABC-type transport system involved in lysophospholipase L1 biosynthesis ATPase subunit
VAAPPLVTLDLRARGLALVLITRDTAIARRSPRIGMMNKGRITVGQATR